MTEEDALALTPVGAFDLDLLAALHLGCFQEPWDRTAFGQLLAMPGAFGLIARDDHQALGFVLCRVVRDEAELLSVCVQPDRRRAGLGRRLVAAALDHCRTQGAQAILLEVAEDNPAAQRLYAALGFTRVGRRPGYYRRPNGVRANALVLRKGPLD